MFFFAAGLLVVFVLAVNLVGDGLRAPSTRPQAAVDAGPSHAGRG